MRSSDDSRESRHSCQGRGRGDEKRHPSREQAQTRGARSAASVRTPKPAAPFDV